MSSRIVVGGLKIECAIGQVLAHRRAARPFCYQEVNVSKSPGHRKWPAHKVQEQRLGERVEVEVNGEVIASSSD